MKQLKGYASARERTNFVGSSKLPVGAYVAKIKDVKYEEGQNGNSDMIRLAYDIVEGEYKGFFQKQFDENTNEDKKWKGKTTVYVPNDDGSEKDNWTQDAFARWTAAFEASNDGYKWDWQEKKWKGLLIGLIYGEVGTVIDGKEIVYTECRFPDSISRVREGKCKIPNLKKKNGYTGNGNTQPAPGSDSDFMTLPEGSEEVPF